LTSERCSSGVVFPVSENGIKLFRQT